MITPQEILAGLSDPTRQVINSGVSQAEFEEIGGVYCMLRNDKTHDDDYKTSLPIPNMQNFVRGMAGCKKDGNEFRRNYAFAFAVLKVIAQTHKNKGAVPIPQEIRLVAAYMVYRAMELADRKYGDIEKADKAVSQSEILKGLGLGHNAFTKWGMRPKQYYYVTHYKQPNSPMHYMGAKTGDYGYAVRNLVYQAGKLSTSARIKLYIVNNCTNRNVLKRKSITCNNICIRTCNNCCTNLKTLRSNDIALYAVFILNKSNMS